jgi:hypothetical protein
LLLNVIQPGKQTVLFYQFLPRSFLDELAMFENGDFVYAKYRAEPVRYDDDRPSFDENRYRFLYLRLVLRGLCRFSFRSAKPSVN